LLSFSRKRTKRGVLCRGGGEVKEGAITGEVRGKKGEKKKRNPHQKGGKKKEKKKKGTT